MIFRAESSHAISTSSGADWLEFPFDPGDLLALMAAKTTKIISNPMKQMDKMAIIVSKEIGNKCM